MIDSIAVVSARQNIFFGLPTFRLVDRRLTDCMGALPS